MQGIQNLRENDGELKGALVPVFFCSLNYLGRSPDPNCVDGSGANFVDGLWSFWSKSMVGFHGGWYTNLQDTLW